jgi:hypothetical protein
LHEEYDRLAAATKTAFAAEGNSLGKFARKIVSGALIVD